MASAHMPILRVVFSEAKTVAKIGVTA
eukprot:COSAG01_NODE_58118_length_308_cov_0.607656_1_plen_26_part_10